MIFINSYLRICTPRNSPFDIKGRYIDAIVTSPESSEFLALLNYLKKPVYGLKANVSISIAKDPKAADERVTVKLSDVAERLIYGQKEVIQNKVTRIDKEKIRVCTSPDLVLIPMFYRNLKIGIGEIQNPINYFQTSEALLFDMATPSGYIDGGVMIDPLNVLDGKPSLVFDDAIASDKEIIDAVWKSKNEIRMKRVYTSQKMFWKDMFVISAPEDSIVVEGTK